MGIETLITDRNSYTLIALAFHFLHITFYLTYHQVEFIQSTFLLFYAFFLSLNQISNTRTLNLNISSSQLFQIYLCEFHCLCYQLFTIILFAFLFALIFCLFSLFLDLLLDLLLNTYFLLAISLL